jgi:undecaprenyl-diphosphatase
MDLWEAALLGAVQGITEFLPISSTAHLLVVRTFLGHPHPEDAFTVAIQLGSLAAMLAYFRQDVRRLVVGAYVALRGIGGQLPPDAHWALLIAVGTLPAGIVGFLGQRWLKEHFYTVPALVVASWIFALLLAAAEIWSARRQRRGMPPRTELDITLGDALWIGLWQAAALVPGGSRSGTTITAGLFAGLNRTAATRFSFVLAVPIILAAGAKELYDQYQLWRYPRSDLPISLFASSEQVAALLMGLIVSALVSYAAIAFLLRFVRSSSMWGFVYYRLFFGVLLLMWWNWRGQ